MPQMMNVNTKGLEPRGAIGSVASNTHKNADFSSRLSSAIDNGAMANTPFSAKLTALDASSATHPQAANRHVSETNVNAQSTAINSQGDVEGKNGQADIDEKLIEGQKVEKENVEENKGEEESVAADQKAQAQVTQILSQLALASQLNEGLDTNSLNTNSLNINTAKQEKVNGFKFNVDSTQKAMRVNAQGQWHSAEMLDVGEQGKQSLADENKASFALPSAMASTDLADSSGENSSGLLNANSRLKDELSVSQTILNIGEGNKHLIEGAPRQSRSHLNTDAPQVLSLKASNELLPSMHNMIMRFSPVMQQQLITMVSQGIQQAEIRLDPAELGQMMVKIQVQGDTTQVEFQVTQAQTRDLIEQALPRLKDMLAEQGMQLSDGQVSYQDSYEKNGSDQQQRDEHTFSAQDLAQRDPEASFEKENDNEPWGEAFEYGIDYYA
ncbi:flagellar hook-length control protein FliK [uncultured Shewanella sp.]|uniref:flagellar hook-length control protein FliK n=1 Tax=uncultured Shewanella sp. TaxID=173975 RepID=UPI002608B102|nr:flagellar hook-length control protein FliK [uncultured Shewanella sp.]